MDRVIEQKSLMTAAFLCIIVFALSSRELCASTSVMSVERAANGDYKLVQLNPSHPEPIT